MSNQIRPFVILDFGSQVTQLIARRLRELGYYSEVHPHDIEISKLQDLNPWGIILSGGPNSVYEESSPQRDLSQIQELAPLLGICYGMQLIAHQLGGVVTKSDSREYGLNEIEWSEKIGRVDSRQKVWMSHGDIVQVPPAGFKVVATSQAGHPAAIKSSKIWGFQFHPEVVHTEKGAELIRAFAEDFCGATPNWTSSSIRESIENKIRDQVGDSANVLCALSGGVDSSVVAALLTRVLGRDRVHCVFVNHGLLRKNEFESVMKQYEQIGLNVTGVEASREFMAALKGLEDPEEKRKAIGKTFIEIFEKNLPPLVNVEFLAQGTLYPDVIESTSVVGNSSHKIKSHHNVGGLPERMKLKLLEPVRELFKDEVRVLGKSLDLPASILGRHPFPGPGLAIRIIGEVEKESLDILREADHVMIEFLKEKALYHKIWQAFCVLLPVKAVGVMGDGRTYEKVLALRAVTSVDGMTADWFPFEFKDLRELSNRITNQVRGVNRVVYDVTSKPPGTIEWE